MVLPCMMSLVCLLVGRMRASKLNSVALHLNDDNEVVIESRMKCVKCEKVAVEVFVDY